LYGEVMNTQSSKVITSEKGWFPGTCVVPIQDNEPDEPKKDK
jgi:hypothetical protein